MRSIPARRRWRRARASRLETSFVRPTSNRADVPFARKAARFGPPPAHRAARPIRAGSRRGRADSPHHHPVAGPAHPRLGDRSDPDHPFGHRAHHRGAGWTRGSARFGFPRRPSPRNPYLLRAKRDQVAEMIAGLLQADPAIKGGAGGERRGSGGGKRHPRGLRGLRAPRPGRGDRGAGDRGAGRSHLGADRHPARRRPG